MKFMPGTTPSLTSPSNPRIKAAVRLRDRRQREQSGLTIVDGAREVRRAIDAGVEVVEAFMYEPMLAGPDARAALDQLRASDTPLHATAEAAFAKLAFGDRSDGLVAVIRVPRLELAGLTPPADPLVAVIDGVEKPGNVGAVLRTADGAGADAVVAASPRTDLLNPNVIRASAGTVFSMPMASASSQEVMTWLRERGVRMLAARVDATQPYTAADLTGPVAIILGNEAQGLDATWNAPDVEPIHLPMLGVADSLNVSVTAGILLYEARRQRDRDARSPD